MHTHTHTHTHAHAHTHTHEHAQTRAHAHTHTHLRRINMYTNSQAISPPLIPPTHPNQVTLEL